MGTSASLAEIRLFTNVRIEGGREGGGGGHLTDGDQCLTG